MKCIIYKTIYLLRKKSVVHTPVCSDYQFQQNDTLQLSLDQKAWAINLYLFKFTMKIMKLMEKLLIFSIIVIF